MKVGHSIPNKANPQIDIAAKLIACDGTARDKVTHIQQLGASSIAGQARDQPAFELACVADRSFGVRREHIKKTFPRDEGEVFTRQKMRQLVETRGLPEYRSW